MLIVSRDTPAVEPDGLDLAHRNGDFTNAILVAAGDDLRRLFKRLGIAPHPDGILPGQTPRENALLTPD